MNKDSAMGIPACTVAEDNMFYCLFVFLALISPHLSTSKKNTVWCLMRPFYMLHGSISRESCFTSSSMVTSPSGLQKNVLSQQTEAHLLCCVA